MKPSLKLYSGNLSPYSAKVRMQIYAKGITGIEFERPPGFFQGEFVSTSPLGRIPALDLGGDIIPESEVIAQYLEEIYPEPSLLGIDARTRARVRTVSRIADIYLMNNIFMALPQINRSTRNEAIRDLFMAQINRGMNALEHYLGDGSYAVGSQISIADCSLVPAFFLCEQVVPTLDVDNPIPSRPKAAGWWARIQADPFASRVLTEMHEGLADRRAGRG